MKSFYRISTVFIISLSLVSLLFLFFIQANIIIISNPNHYDDYFNGTLMENVQFMRQGIHVYMISSNMKGHFDRSIYDLDELSLYDAFLLCHAKCYGYWCLK